MGKAIFITGTDTDVGKTFVSGAIMYNLKKYGHNAIYYKPVQSGGFYDVEFIKETANLKEDINKMNTYTFREPLSPHLAANLENIKIDKYEIINEFKNLKNKYDYVVVEGAGGVIVPLIDNDYFIYDLIKDLNLDVLLVNRAGLGTINHTSLTCEFLKSKDISIKGLVINNYNGIASQDDNIKSIKNINKIENTFILNRCENNELVGVYENLDIDFILNLFK